MREYRIKVKKGFVWYKLHLLVKIWFFWWPVEGWKMKIGNESGVESQLQDWISSFDVKDENVIINE